MAKAIKGKVIFVNSPSLEALEKGFSLLKGYPVELIEPDEDKLYVVEGDYTPEEKEQIIRIRLDVVRQIKERRAKNEGIKSI